MCVVASAIAGSPAGSQAAAGTSVPEVPAPVHISRKHAARLVATSRAASARDRGRSDTHHRTVANESVDAYRVDIFFTDFLCFSWCQVDRSGCASRSARCDCASATGPRATTKAPSGASLRSSSASMPVSHGLYRQNAPFLDCTSVRFRGNARAALEANGTTAMGVAGCCQARQAPSCSVATCDD